MKPIDDKAKNGNWIAIPRPDPITTENMCPYILVRWTQTYFAENVLGDYCFVDGFGRIYYPDTYYKLI